MSGGRKAYITELGKKPTEIVDIFDYAPPESVGSVGQQSAFHVKWVESLKTKYSESETPLTGEIEEAMRHPNGWVYRIVGSFDPNGEVPPEAIVGAWKVDVHGKIIGPFIKNQNFDPERWPNKPGAPAFRS